MTPITKKVDEIEKIYMQDRYIPESEFEELREMINKWAKKKGGEFNG